PPSSKRSPESRFIDGPLTPAGDSVQTPRMRPALLCLLCCGACGDNSTTKATTKATPESIATNAKDGDHVEIVGEVHTVTFDSTQRLARRVLLAMPQDPVAWVVNQDDEEARGVAHAYDDTGAQYPRTPDHYILIRSVKPAGVTQGETGFTPGKLLPAWGLGIHVTTVDGDHPMPEIGTQIKVTGTFRRVMWNQREMVPIIDDPTIEIVSGPPALAGPGAACKLDQECNARLICDRTSLTCAPTPREIYWADPWRDVNGVCDTDMDCPLGQLCNVALPIASTGAYAAHYFTTEDVGRHVCILAPDARTVAAQCPRIYIARDLSGGRFASGKEVCVRVRLKTPTYATDNDTHDQMDIDEPIPYPTADLAYNLWGSTTENGPIYKDPALGAAQVNDPAVGQEVIAIGTFRYDPDHGWYEVHPIKAFLPPP
ncbi:MAG: hypothetical protein JWO36_7196, partial [Myxococcales bacterium]|nr:hypothetical protein [Myxococcales bacterium]